MANQYIIQGQLATHGLPGMCCYKLTEMITAFISFQLANSNVPRVQSRLECVD